MIDRSQQAKQGFPLSKSGDPTGVSCDAEGPSLGPIRLLEHGAEGFAPRPADDLDAILSAAFGHPVSCEGLLPGLMAVARALDAGDMARACFATQHLRLPNLDEAQARRAVAMLRKVSQDDEKHPRWAKGTPDSVGGEYKSKDGGSAGETDKRRQRLGKKALRVGLGRVLSFRRLARLALGDIGQYIPGLGTASEILEAKQLVEMAEDLKLLSQDIKAMAKFLDEDLHSLESLQVNAKNESFASSKDIFSSMDAFVKLDLEKRFGSAGEGYEYHHIVEQGGQNARQLAASDLRSPRNIIRLPKFIHEMITSDYASSAARGRTSFRSQLRGKSFDEQYSFGKQTMKQLGIIK